MKRTNKIDQLKSKAQHLADEDRREAAAKEARRRFHEMKASLASTADHVSDVAEEQWEQARDAAGPTVKRMRKRAVDVIDNDLEWLRGELSDVSGQVGRGLITLGTDVKDASRVQTDRILQAIHDNAEQAREEERRKRVRALIGWTAFGMVAGAVLALQFGPKSDEDQPVESEPTEPESTEDGDLAEGVGQT